MNAPSPAHAVTTGTLNDLERVVRCLPVQVVESYESYSLSSGYFEVTGRTGLAVFQLRGNVLVACDHPNVGGTTLIFPEVGTDVDYDLTWRAIATLLPIGQQVRLARFTAAQKAALVAASRTHASKLGVALLGVAEDLLDWRFPVYVLSTAATIARRGPRFAQVRQRLNKLERNRFVARNLDPYRDALSVMHCVTEWAGQSKKHKYSVEDLTAPARKVLALILKAPARYFGQVIELDGKIRAYSVVEQAAYDPKLGNQLACAAARTVKGLSEWLFVEMCEAARERGVEQINIGGSETHGLDRFKRKFAPVKVIDLASLVVAPQAIASS